VKRLWAPWRMEYILAEHGDGCFLCDMFQGRDDRENLVLFRGKLAAVVINRYPYNNGHLMVAPYRHLPDLNAISPEERSEMMELTARCIPALKEVMHPDGFNIGINLGQTAGAGLQDHVHLHIVPRWNGDTNFMPVIAETKVIPQALHDLWDRLHPVIAR